MSAEVNARPRRHRRDRNPKVVGELQPMPPSDRPQRLPPDFDGNGGGRRVVTSPVVDRTKNKLAPVHPGACTGVVTGKARRPPSPPTQRKVLLTEITGRSLKPQPVPTGDAADRRVQRLLEEGTGMSRGGSLLSIHANEPAPWGVGDTNPTNPTPGGLPQQQQLQHQHARGGVAAGAGRQLTDRAFGQAPVFGGASASAAGGGQAAVMDLLQRELPARGAGGRSSFGSGVGGGGVGGGGAAPRMQLVSAPHGPQPPAIDNELRGAAPVDF
jgi:hypothetical protein